MTGHHRGVIGMSSSGYRGTNKLVATPIAFCWRPVSNKKCLLDSMATGTVQSCLEGS
jgi:hypothetical protein